MFRNRKKCRIFKLKSIFFIFAVLLSTAAACDTKADPAEQSDSALFEESDAAEKTDEETWTVSLDDIPEYSGENYVELNNNIPVFSEPDTYSDTFVRYSELDALGRCGTAFAVIGRETIPTEERGMIGPVEPSGWQTVKYNDIIDGNYLYNRCHLIAYQLAGDNDDERNLITGTRWMNVQGMLPFENEVADYVKSTGNHVLYQVQPVFNGDDLVAAGVWMEAMSVEDTGESLSYNVFVYNVQPGIEIDYTTGDNKLSDNYEHEQFSLSQDVSKEDAVRIAEGSGEEKQEIPKDVSYIANKNSMKFHRPSCPSVDDMAEHNKAYFYGDREEVTAAGYVPCKWCKP